MRHRTFAITPIGGLIADVFNSYKPTYIMGSIIAIISIALVLAIRKGQTL